MKLRYLQILCILTATSCCPSPDLSIAEPPRIFPDYTGVTIPPNMAPLDFCIDDEHVSKIHVSVAGRGDLHISSRGTSSTHLPVRKWHKLLAASKGDSISITVTVKTDSCWIKYSPFHILVSRDSIDYGLCYRKIAPGYEAFGPMGIYERDLSSFREKRLIDNSRFIGCVNCHSFNQCSPEDFSLHIRGPFGGTLLRKGGETKAYDTKTEKSISTCVYPYWHPSGDFIAYSSNITRQGFHVCSEKMIEVFDQDSDVQIYNVRTGQLLIPEAISRKDRWETFPAFSPDMTWLYFTAAEPKDIPDSLFDIRYNLYRVRFDMNSGECGSPEDVETVINADSAGKSIAFPKPSFDGRFLMYTLSDYGTFPIWHQEADLWLLNLQTGESVPLLEANSCNTESYHNWNSSSRWFVYSSRRMDGLYTQLFLCHIDESGNIGKPFLLPQRNPKEYYSKLFFSFNVPEFITSPVCFNTRKAVGLINSKKREPFKSRPQKTE